MKSSLIAEIHPGLITYLILAALILIVWGYLYFFSSGLYSRKHLHFKMRFLKYYREAKVIEWLPCGVVIEKFGRWVKITPNDQDPKGAFITRSFQPFNEQTAL